MTSDDELTGLVEICQAGTLMVEATIQNVMDQINISDAKAFEWAESNKERFLMAVGLMCVTARETGISKGLFAPDME